MNNPTSEIDISFDKYISERSIKQGKHLQHGIPDYAYAMDYSIRQKINRIPGFFKLGKVLTSTYVAQQRQGLLMTALQVSREQFPEIYQMGVHCARTLGIGVPSIFIESTPELNAYTLACEDNEPIVVLNSALVERLTADELLGVIGHECGHIHNNHTLYNCIVGLLIDAGTHGLRYVPGVIGAALKALLLMFRDSITLPLKAWSRAAEVTADRAAIICAGGADSVISGDMKLTSGGMFGSQYQNMNVDALIAQYEKYRNSPMVYKELVYATHPTSARRILADREFMKSEIFYEWHPELKKTDMSLLSKEELDANCDKIISILKSVAESKNKSESSEK